MAPSSPNPLPPPLAAFEPLIERLACQIADIVADRLALPVKQEEPPWMLTDAAALHLGCSKHRLYKLTASGAIPHYKQEGRLFFHRAELDQWMTGRAQGRRP